MTFCYAPWSNLEILPQGEILPCCKFQSNHYGETFNIKQHTIDQYRQSKMLATIKQEFEQGVWPPGCERCRIEEENNIESKRQLDYTRWQKHYQNYDLESDTLLTVSMALGNTCNLKCIICNPSASSKWAKEYQDIYNIQVQNIETVRKDLITSITTIAPNLIHIDMHGGEPLLSSIEQHQALLDHYIKTDQAKNITIHYTTNATIFPDRAWLERWGHFAEIDLQLSIDGVGARYEYLRYPADWTEVNANIDQYLELQQRMSNVRLSIAHTVSAFNIFYLEEFVTWCQQTGLPRPWMGKLHKPMHLRPSVWPDLAKLAIVNKLQSSIINDVRVWANLIQITDDSKLFIQFQQFVREHDQYRNLNFKATFPEIAQYI
jgi:radical SAM protein with 4Fe4S-binding SPASM domain